MGKRTLLCGFAMLNCILSTYGSNARGRFRWLRVRGGHTEMKDGRSSGVRGSQYELVEEYHAFRGRWRSILRRRVRYPNGREVAFDVTNQPGSSVVVFAWDTATQTSTLVEEYAPGSCSMIMGPVAGGVETEKHRDAIMAAEHELEEEAHLVGGKMYSLLHGNNTILADKYSTNPFHFYLVIDPIIEPNPKPQDDEELLTIHRGISVAKIRQLIRSGCMTVPGALCCMLALERLQEMGLVEPEKKFSNVSASI